MDFFGATSKIFTVYNKIRKMIVPQSGLGLFEYKYKLKGDNLAFILCIITKEDKAKTGKKKVFDKVIDKSTSKNKPIVPKYFKYIKLYLNNIIDQIATPRGEVVDRLKDLMAGFRLKFFMKHNLKYTFKNSSNPTIIIHEGTSSKGQYFCFIHVFNVKEEGLVLAHERQIKYIKQELEKGVNPIDIKQLPSLRTGNTYLDAKSAGKSEEEDNVPDVSTKLKKFRKQIKQKKASKDIEEELDYKTIISNHSDDSQDKKQIPRSPPNLNPADALFGGPQSIANDQAAKKVDKPTTMEFNTVKVSPELEHSKLKTKLKNKEDQINKLRKKNQAAESINTMMKNKVEYLEKENKQYKQQLQDMTENLSEKLSKKDEEIGALNQFRQANQILTKNISKISQENEDLKEKIAYLESEKMQIKDELEEQKRVSFAEMKKLDNTVEVLLQEKQMLVNKLKNSKKNESRVEESKITEILQENQLLGEAIRETDEEFQQVVVDYKNLLKENELKVKDKEEYDIKIEERIKELEEENKKLRSKIRSKELA